MESKEKLTGFRLRLYETIFEADTLAGRLFDISLLCCIVLSIVVIMLQSVATINEQYGRLFTTIEWVLTLIFTAEFLARCYAVISKRKYLLSFFGIVDLLSIMPTYLALFFTGAQSLLVIRSIRLLRIFRILKLSRYIGEGQNLVRALKASQHKITVFMLTVITSVVITGTIMFLVEGPENGFTNIPRSIYWAVVTMTTVGYGDIAPKTPLGQTIASFIMIMGYGIIAVPTGIVSAEMVQLKGSEKVSGQVCPHCIREGHDVDATHCKFCGGLLNH